MIEPDYSTLPTTDTPENKIQAIEQEMKLLHWHKLANDAALKAALIRTKKMKRVDHKAAQRQQYQREKAAWMSQVIQEEQRKPLQVSKEFIRKYEEDDKSYEERLDRDIQRHIISLKKLKDGLEKRESVKMRRVNYVKNKSILKAHEAALNQRKAKIKEEALRGEDSTANLPPPIMEQYADSSNISAVVGSLDKLVQLGKRVAELEAETEIATRIKMNRRRGDATSSLSIRKSRIAASLTQPATTIFDVRSRRSAASRSRTSNKSYNKIVDARKVAMRKRRENLKKQNEILRRRQEKRRNEASKKNNQSNDFNTLKRDFDKKRRAIHEKRLPSIGGSSIKGAYAAPVRRNKRLG
eukprot:GSMAST32.ASY1.ANO1.1315.1 assembled CDS